MGAETVINTSNQQTTNYDTSKIFIWNNRFQTENYNNSGYDAVDLVAGTVMGRVAATGKIVPLDSGASDGSQYPVGILNQDWTVDGGDDQNVSICIAGDVAVEKIVFATEGDDLETIVDGKQLKDRIQGDTMGIKLVPGTDLTGTDNE